MTHNIISKSVLFEYISSVIMYVRVIISIIYGVFEYNYPSGNVSQGNNPLFNVFVLQSFTSIILSFWENTPNVYPSQLFKLS